MMPPISIDGTDITGATIDGQDVQEITVDGQTVFSAGPNLPVAYSNLVAWYPFDSATYGGANADDVTGILGGSGDDTSYDGTVSGASYQSSGGVTDINAGANSGAFDFDNDNISTSKGQMSTPFTAMAWAKVDSNIDATIVGDWNSSQIDWLVDYNDNVQAFRIEDDTKGVAMTKVVNLNEWYHVAAVCDDDKNEIYLNGDFEDDITFSSDSRTIGGGSVDIGSLGGSVNEMDGTIDDVRIYDTALTSTQIEQIVENTQDPNNPVYP